MSRIRALVVEDSLTIRKRIVEILGADPEIEVVGEAEDGAKAIESCHALKPDVITMDMMLPVMTGLSATEYIMAHRPTPILVVSASTNRGELFRTYDALAAGAVDVLEKPAADAIDGAWERRLVSTVKLVSRIKVITHLRARLATPALTSWRTEQRAAGGTKTAERTRVIALGASTGGPGALLTVLKALPAGFRVPVLIVLHLGEPFAAAFGDWLEAQTAHPVDYAKDGDVPSPGTMLLAPPGKHLVLRNGRLRLTSDPELHSCRPSVDALFQSLAEEQGSGIVAALLTGMGKDGAAGLLAIRRAGGLTIAQDEATSVVYGMPREAALLGAAERVLPLAEIGPALAALAPSKEPR